MDVRPGLVQSLAGMSHHAELIALLHPLTLMHRDRTQVAVKTVVFAAVESVFDHDVAAVIRPARDLIRVYDHTGRDGADHIERLAACVALKRLNVHALMQPRVNNSRGRFDWIADKTIAAAFPRRGFFAMIIALDVLVERRAVAAEERVIVGRQDEIEWLGAGERSAENNPANQRRGLHGGLIKGLTISATPKAFEAD